MSKVGRWMAGAVLGLGIALAPAVLRVEATTVVPAACTLECTPLACCKVRADGAICSCCWRGDSCDESSGGGAPN